MATPAAELEIDEPLVHSLLVEQQPDLADLPIRTVANGWDNVVLQLGLSFSRFHARQLVNHGHVLVNGKRCNIPSYLVRPGDEVGVSKAEHVRKISASAVDINKGQGVPAWLEATPSDLRGKVIQLPKREDVPHPINEQLIIELCSK